MVRDKSSEITAEEFVDQNRDELMEILLHGDETLRAIAIAILLEGGQESDIAVVKRELDLYQDLSDEVRENLK